MGITKSLFIECVVGVPDVVISLATIFINAPPDICIYPSASVPALAEHISHTLNIYRLFPAVTVYTVVVVVDAKELDFIIVVPLSTKDFQSVIFAPLSSNGGELNKLGISKAIYFTSGILNFILPSFLCSHKTECPIKTLSSPTSLLPS